LKTIVLAPDLRSFGYEPNSDPTDFCMATWMKDAMYGLLLTRGAFIKENPVNKHGGKGNAWLAAKSYGFFLFLPLGVPNLL
jgi:hypothetical protein